MSNVPGWVTAKLRMWGNYNFKWINHEPGWASEEAFLNPGTFSGVFESRALLKDMPEIIRVVDIAVMTLPDPMPRVVYAKHCLLRFPDGREVYDSDRAAWFENKGIGWFTNQYRFAKYILFGKFTQP
jgi:hypothetical protein